MYENSSLYIIIYIYIYIKNEIFLPPSALLHVVQCTTPVSQQLKNNTIAFSALFLRLCNITSRSLKQYPGHTVPKWDYEHISNSFSANSFQLRFPVKKYLPQAYQRKLFLMEP